MLDIKEFAWISTSGNHIENIFKRIDRDESGSLTQRETAAYIRSVTHGKTQKQEHTKTGWTGDDAINRLNFPSSDQL